MCKYTTDMKIINNNTERERERIKKHASRS